MCNGPYIQLLYAIIMKIVSPNFSIKNKDKFIYGVAMRVVTTFTIIIINAFIFGKEYEELKFLFTIITLFICLTWLDPQRFIRRLFNDWKVDDHIIGSINFNKDELTLNYKDRVQKISYHQINKVNLTYNHIKGLAFGKGHAYSNGLSKIQIESPNSLEEIKFLIQNEVDRNILIDILKELRKNRISVKEHLISPNNNLDLIFLEYNPSQKKIDAYKKELNLEKI